MSEYNLLKDFIERDQEKSELMESLKQPILRNANASLISNTTFASEQRKMSLKLRAEEIELSQCDYTEPMMMKAEPEKFCPKCGRKFFEEENFCPDCLVILKNITDEVDIKGIDFDPDMEYPKKTVQENILTEDNFNALNAFGFTINDFNRVTFSIKAQAFRNLDYLIREYDLDLDEMDVLDKVILFSKSFVEVEYKSYGGQLGYFEFDRIYVDDRQRNSLQITTLVHELTHFLIKEILTRIVCEILDCTKNMHVESVVTYILSRSVFNNLIDEYAAHSVEGRFTIFGYQDYSSFLALQDELEAEHVDIAKTIGNTFSIYIKELLEGFLDWDVRNEIKDQFLEDTIERPNYSQLQFESCNKLSDEGFMKAIWLILTDGFQNADEEVIAGYAQEYKKT